MFERMIEHKWSDSRVRDAVNNLIDTHPYKSINPANVLSYDRREKLFSYPQMVEQVNKYGSRVWETHTMIEVDGVKYWRP